MAAANATAAWHSLRGRRDTNQDAALVHWFEDGRLVVAVADGLGGHKGGKEASRRALEALRGELIKGGSLVEAVGAANAAVHEEAASTPSLSKMGTTLVALLSGPHEYTIANVGDSRAYRVGGEEIRQVTEDHSFAFEALGKGMSQEEIDASPWRNALTRVIGTDPQVEVDVFGPFSTEEPHCVCLCTDGLYRALSSERMLEVIRESPDLEGVSKRLTELAYREGSADNITVALLSVGNGNPVLGAVDLASPGVASVHPGFSVAHPARWTGSRRRPWKRRIRLSHKAKIELWGGAITVLLALALAYFVL